MTVTYTTAGAKSDQDVLPSFSRISISRKCGTPVALTGRISAPVTSRRKLTDCCPYQKGLVLRMLAGPKFAIPPTHRMARSVPPTRKTETLNYHTNNSNVRASTTQGTTQSPTNSNQRQHIHNIKKALRPPRVGDAHGPWKRAKRALAWTAESRENCDVKPTRV